MYYVKILHCVCESDFFQGSLGLFLFCGHTSSATVTGTQARCHVPFMGKVSPPLVPCSGSWQEGRIPSSAFPRLALQTADAEKIFVRIPEEDTSSTDFLFVSL